MYLLFCFNLCSDVNFFFFKQKTAYELRISDWSSDVCSSDLVTAISKEDKFLLKGLHSGAVDYLYKPLNPDITVAKVKSFMQQVYIQRELKRKNEELERSDRKSVV